MRAERAGIAVLALGCSAALLAGCGSASRKEAAVEPAPRLVRPWQMHVQRIAERSDVARIRSSDQVVLGPSAPVTTPPWRVTWGGVAQDSPIRAQPETVADIRFAFGSAVLEAGARAALDRLVPHVRAPDVARLVVEGRADDLGSSAFNLKLSIRRADAVRDHLAAAGVPTAKIQPVGLGEGAPRAPNDTPEGRAVNRSAVITAWRTGEGR
jgi:outer membrane protein OmpA-like peptidoglycan-associated protein